MIRLKRTTFLLISTLIFAQNSLAKAILGTILDKDTNEPLIGVAILVKGTSKGSITDFDGNYAISDISNGDVLQVSYISYKSITTQPLDLSKTDKLVKNFLMESDNIYLNEAVVYARKNLETDMALQGERINSSYAIENMGAKEMQLKGISTVAEGVKKISGVTIADAGQLFVRGLGDRYSLTTLNGMPIASPNPDHKLIPLDLFPVSTVKNITVSKVYQVTSFADYSGAHIDISTKESVGDDFFSISANVGGNIGTLFKDFYKSDSKGLMYNTNLSSDIKEMSPKAFSEYIKVNDPFGTTFSISKRNSLPDFGMSFGIGKSWELGTDKLSMLASLGVNNEHSSKKDSYVTTLTAQGTKLNEFTYDDFSSEMRIAGLANVGYDFSRGDRIGYTLFYARNAVDDYKLRQGFDSEGIPLIGSNSVLHVYSLVNSQIGGQHLLTSRIKTIWNGSYSSTQSNEPDRRQVMFRTDADTISLFKLNKQETMRYFGMLSEDELAADLKLTYSIGGYDENKLTIGGVYKNKNRDFSSVRFYYNLSNINPSISDIYNTDGYLNQSNIANGIISITKDAQPKSSYQAGSRISAAFTEMNYRFSDIFLLNIGVRYEYSNQLVTYRNDASIRKRSELITEDFFPAVNLKFNMDRENSVRLAFSKTVTRPSFIEMAPFLYKESYGSSEIRGNEDLQNGYNYNVDLRYELIPSGTTDMISVTLYYKYLSSPIEQVQESSGGSAVHSFRNAEDGMASGLEMELRKSITSELRFGFNASYMYTNVILPENGGVYTDTKRALQGASPYIVNADVTYSPNLKNDSQMSVSLLYNLQGPRIQTVGIYGMSNVVQQEQHRLDLVGNYSINKNLSMKLQLKNLLNNTIRFTQEIDKIKKPVVVERFREGMDFQLGFTYKF